MHVIKGLGFFSSIGCSVSPMESQGRSQDSSQAEPDYRSAVRLQKKSFSCWTDCLLRIINHLGHMTFFPPLKLLSNLAIWKWNPIMTKSSFIHYQNLILQMRLGRTWGHLPLLEVDQEEYSGNSERGWRFGLEEVVSFYLYISSSYYVQDTVHNFFLRWWDSHFIMRKMSLQGCK